MAKKTSNKSDRSDPRKNKSLAIRTVLKRTPDAKASEIADAVKKEFGHTVPQNMIYMVKTKGNMASNRRRQRGGGAGATASKGKSAPMNSPAMWVDAIRVGRQLLKATGSVDNATALLRAIEGE